MKQGDTLARYLLGAAVVLCLMLSAGFADAAGDTAQEHVRFEITRFLLDGNTLLSADTVTSVLSPFIGKDRDFGTVQEALETLENAYRDRGFPTIMVLLPEQELEKGVVRLRVVEGKIGKINIKGALFFQQDNIRSSLPSLQQGQSPNVNALSRSLKVANENPSKKMNLQLRTGDEEGSIDATVTVRDENPWNFGLSFDTTGDRQTGYTRLGFLLQHANVANLDHTLTLQFITSPEKPDHVKIYSAGYRIPFYEPGSSLDVFAIYSDVDSGTVAASTSSMQLSGKGTMLGARYNQNLTRIGGYEHKVTLGLDYRAYKNTVFFEGTDLGSAVTVHPMSLTYTGNYTTGKLNAGFYLTFAQNLPGSWDGKDTQARFEAARVGASPDYMLFRFGANATYVFGGDWQLRALFNGQYAARPLVPGEQFGIGGATSVRGFREREFYDDKGISGSMELHTPDLSKLLGISAFQSRALLFYDIGSVSRNKPLPGERASMTIASIGPGIRITDGKKYMLSTDVGLVVDPGDTRSRWNGRWHVAASILF